MHTHKHAQVIRHLFTGIFPVKKFFKKKRAVWHIHAQKLPSEWPLPLPVRCPLPPSFSIITFSHSPTVPPPLSHYRRYSAYSIDSQRQLLPNHTELRIALSEISWPAIRLSDPNIVVSLRISSAVILVRQSPFPSPSILLLLEPNFILPSSLCWAFPHKDSISSRTPLLPKISPKTQAIVSSYISPSTTKSSRKYERTMARV